MPVKSVKNKGRASFPFDCSPNWKIKQAFVAVLFIFLTTSYSNALERFDLVTTEGLHKLLQERQEGKTDFLLINTLDTLIFNHHSIPGSINVPWGNVAKFSHLLSQDKNKLIITYCMGYR